MAEKEADHLRILDQLQNERDRLQNQLQKASEGIIRLNSSDENFQKVFPKLQNVSLN